LSEFFMACLTFFLVALLGVFDLTLLAGHVEALLNFFGVTDFGEFQTTLLEWFFAADFSWSTLALLRELCRTFFREFFEAFLLIFHTAHLPVGGVALLLVLGLALGGVLHLARGRVLSLAVISDLISAHLFIGGSTMWRHHFLPFKVTFLGRGMIVGQCMDSDQDKME